MLAYPIRHAESLANAGLDPSLNSLLSPLGQQQVQALARRFAAASISAIYSSPYTRCIETAIPIARELDLPVRIRPELCEYHHLAPGTPAETGLDHLDEIIQRHPGAIPCPDHHGPFHWPLPDESDAQVIARTKALADCLKRRWPDPEDSVILISHGSPIARLVEAWIIERPGPWYRFVIDAAAVSALRYSEDVSTLLCLNEVSHLSGLPPPQGANFQADGTIGPVLPE